MYLELRIDVQRPRPHILTIKIELLESSFTLSSAYWGLTEILLGFWGQKIYLMIIGEHYIPGSRTQGWKSFNLIFGVQKILLMFIGAH